MSPTADARTGHKAYADCRRDCRNTGINIQRDQQEVNACALLPLPVMQFLEHVTICLNIVQLYNSRNLVAGVLA